MPACESPISATVVFEFTWPAAHSGGVRSFHDNTHPLRNTSGLVMLPSDGERFDGTARRFADVATAARSCSAGVRAFGAGPGTGACTAATGMAAGPDPVGTNAARRVATRYVDGYVSTAIRPLEDGFMPMRTHFSVCEKARKTRPAKPAAKPADGAPALF